MAARLVFLDGSKVGSTFELGDEPVTIGRSATSTVAYANHEILVSAEQATIVRRDDGFFVRDNKSRNGTFVNSQPIAEKALQNGDVIQFGAGGPRARFVLDAAGIAPTLDLAATTAQRGRSLSDAGGTAHPTRDLVALSLQRMGSQYRRIITGAVIVTLVAIIAFFYQQRRASGMRDALTQFSTAVLESQAGLAQNLSQVDSRYAELRDAKVALEDRLPLLSRPLQQTLGEYGKGVVLIFYSYGYRAEGGYELLRYVVDEHGQVATVRGPRGVAVPQLTFSGSGPVVERSGVATGFLADTSGIILASRWVIAPWNGSAELAQLEGQRLALTGKIITLKAFFPPGNQVFSSFSLYPIDTTKGNSLIKLQVIGGRPAAPVIPLMPTTGVPPSGGRAVVVGYPSELHLLLFRATEEIRDQIRRAGTDDEHLVGELAKHGLVMPLAVEDTIGPRGSAMAHSAARFVAAGGPVVGEERRVIGFLQPLLAGGTDSSRFVPVRFAEDALAGRSPANP